MSDSRRSTMAWGGASALFLTTALLTATVFTGPAASMGTNVIAAIAAAAQMGVAFLFTGLLAKTFVRRLLSAISKRFEKQLASSVAEQRAMNEVLAVQLDRATGTLAERVAEHDRTATELAEDVTEQAKATGSLARSLRLQTESITLIRKQTRTILEDLDGRHSVDSDTLAAATEGRAMSRKLLNLVRNEQRDTQAQMKPFAPLLRDITKRTDELETGQRRVMNFLRKEGSIQVVLDKLIATERRLVTSVEAGALTSADELSSATAQRIGELHENLSALQREVGDLSSRTDRVGVDVSAAIPRMREVTAGLGSLRDESVALRAERSTVDSAARDDMAQMRERLDALSARVDQALVAMADADSAQNVGGERINESLAGVHESLDTVLRLADTTKTDVKGIGPRIERNGIEVVKQVEALIQLLGRVDTSTQRYPSTGGWAMTPDSLLLLSDLVREKRPQRIVELGSGSSTVWVGAFAKSIGATLLSFEHLEEYRTATALSLETFDLEGTVDLRLAELTDIEVNGETRKWYDPRAFEDLESIDMLIVDGPPKATGPESRLPAFQKLRDKLAPGALIVVDDLHRGQEAEMVQTWMEEDASLFWTQWDAGRTGVLEYGGNQRGQRHGIS